MKQNQKGFTLIELLVVVAIIGLLASVVVVSLNSARAKARDAKRLTDIKSLQNALELYFNNNGGAYPTTNDGLAVLAPTYIATVPVAPTPADGSCGNNNTYVYTSASTSTYSLAFCLGGTTGGLSGGTATASPTGITQ